MRHLNLLASLLCMSLAIMSIALTPGNAHGGDGNIANFENGDWTTNVRFDSVRISVAGPSGYYWQDTVESAAAMSLPNKQLRDGLYTYELRFAPSGTSNREMAESGSQDANGRAVEEVGSRNTPDRPVVVTGTFRISNGSIVQASDDEVE